ncbi:nitroreductase family protein, partial [Verrucomicrobiota bacterium]
MIELLRERRTIRRYETRAVEAQKVELLKETLLRSPSSRNFRPWEFCFVSDAAKLVELSECKPHGAAFLAGAPLGVVICADPARCDVWIEDASIAAILLQLTAQDLGLGSCWLQVRNRQHSGGD